MTGNRRSVWGRYFDDVSRKKGDTEAANSYFSVKNFRFLRDGVLSLLDGARGLRILDVGCGTGHLSLPLAGENRIVGVDISLEMLVFARSKGLAAVLAAAEDLPFRTGSFDVVLANSVIQLIPDGERFIRELVRAVRPGGRVIISTINAENATMSLFRRLERKKYEHFRLYPFAELKALVSAARGVVQGSLFLYYPFGTMKALRGSGEPGIIPRRLATSVIVDAVRPE
jgi:2-polyprenyl-3-methyl-5-hydroxy-6-metoxy-1,4-benzoquinol methylase